MRRELITGGLFTSLSKLVKASPLQREKPKARATCTTTHGNGQTSMKPNSGGLSAYTAENCSTSCALRKPPMVGECRRHLLECRTRRMKAPLEKEKADNKSWEREELMALQSTMLHGKQGTRGKRTTGRGTVAARVALRSTMIGGTQRARGRLADNRAR